MSTPRDIVTNHLSVTRTARYFLSAPDGPPRGLLLACHGYAQAAEPFLKEVCKADLPGLIVVAPEGLSRFYRRGFEGEVVASWMTREDRQHEILDQAAYLDQLMDHLEQQFGSLPLNILGFSQGVPTVCRWMASSCRSADRLILWQGMVPEAETMDRLADKLPAGIDLVLGDEDPFFTKTREDHLYQAVQGSFPSARWHRFAGAHELNPILLNQLLTPG